MIPQMKNSPAPPQVQDWSVVVVDSLEALECHVCWVHGYVAGVEFLKVIHPAVFDMLLGRLEPEWNWLVGVQPKPARPKIAHYTLGGPWLPAWEHREHDDIWLAAAQNLRARG